MMQKMTAFTLLHLPACLVLAAQDAPERIPLNAKISSAYTLSRFDQKLGTASAQIDPYGEAIAYTQSFEFKGADSADRNAQSLCAISSKVAAGLSPNSFALSAFSWDYRFQARACRAALEPDGSLRLDGRSVPCPANLGPTPELFFLRLVQTGRLAQDSRHTASMLFPSDQGFALSEVTFRVIGPEFRRYADQITSVQHLTTENPPETCSLRDFYIDAMGRLMEAAAVDKTRIVLTSETQFTRISQKVRTAYQAVAIVPQDQEERRIGAMTTEIDPAHQSYTAERTLRRILFDVVGEAREAWNIGLSPGFQLETLRYTRSFAGSDLKAEFDAHTRKLVYSAPGQKDVVIELAPDSRFCGTLDLAGVILTQREELLTGKIHRVVVMDPDARGIKELVLVIQGAMRREYLGRPTSVLRAQVAAGTRIVAEMYLDKYGRALEVSADDLRLIALKNEKDVTPAPAESNPFVRAQQNVLREDEIELDKLAHSYLGLKQTWDRMKLAIDAVSPHDIDALYPSLKGAFEAFTGQLAVYRQSLKGRDEEWRVALWESEAQQWLSEAQRLVPVERQVYIAFTQELGRIVALLKQGRYLEAESRVQIVADILKEARPEMRDQMQRMWAPVFEEIAAQHSRAALEGMTADLSSIAWEQDYVLVPVRIRMDLLGSGLNCSDTIQLKRVRAYCVLNGKLYKEGDSFVVDGQAVTISKIEKDKVTLRSGKALREVLNR